MFLSKTYRWCGIGQRHVLNGWQGEPRPVSKSLKRGFSAAAKVMGSYLPRISRAPANTPGVGTQPSPRSTAGTSHVALSPRICRGGLTTSIRFGVTSISMYDSSRSG